MTVSSGCGLTSQVFVHIKFALDIIIRRSRESGWYRGRQQQEIDFGRDANKAESLQIPG